MANILKIGAIALLYFSINLSLSAQQACVDINHDSLLLLLEEANYENFRRTEIVYAEDPYDIEYEVHFLKNYTYKLVFDMSGKSEGVVVKLFDLGEKKSAQTPTLIYESSEDIMKENKTFEVDFKAPKNRLLVKYEVKDATFPGCVTLVLGYYAKKKLK